MDNQTNPITPESILDPEASSAGVLGGSSTASISSDTSNNEADDRDELNQEDEPEFPRFGDLPIEIRLMIWKMCIPSSSRAINTFEVYRYGCSDLIYEAETLFLINKEANQIALETIAKPEYNTCYFRVRRFDLGLDFYQGLSRELRLRQLNHLVIKCGMNISEDITIFDIEGRLEFVFRGILQLLPESIETIQFLLGHTSPSSTSSDIFDSQNSRFHKVDEGFMTWVSRVKQPDPLANVGE